MHLSMLRLVVSSTADLARALQHWERLFLDEKLAFESRW